MDVTSHFGHSNFFTVATFIHSAASHLIRRRRQAKNPRPVERRQEIPVHAAPGVYPVAFKVEHTDHAALNKEVIDELQRRGVVREGDIVIITKGDLEKPGSTNAMKIVKVGELVAPRVEGSCE